MIHSWPLAAGSPDWSAWLGERVWPTAAAFIGPAGRLAWARGVAQWLPTATRMRRPLERAGSGAQWSRARASLAKEWARAGSRVRARVECFVSAEYLSCRPLEWSRAPAYRRQAVAHQFLKGHKVNLSLMILFNKIPGRPKVFIGHWRRLGQLARDKNII